MKKSKIFQICGICLLVMALVIDVVLSCVFTGPGAIVFDMVLFSRLLGDVVTAVIGIVLLRYSKKLAKEEKED